MGREDLEYILNQSLRKEYEPTAELLEQKMSRLWVAFFTPIMPLGVLMTLFANILEVYFDTTKLLWSRQRPTSDAKEHVPKRRKAMPLSNVGCRLEIKLY